MIRIVTDLSRQYFWVAVQSEKKSNSGWQSEHQLAKH
jgi:hypothetical protein